MRITVLGSGTVDPHPDRASSGYFLETAAGPMVMDLGSGALRRAVSFGLPIANANRILLSHLHPDHTVDLVPFLFARKHAPSPWTNEPDLTIHGPPGCREFLEILFQAWPSLEPKPGMGCVHVVEFEPDGGVFFSSDGVEATAVRVDHGNQATFGFRVASDGGVLAYSADTCLCQGVKEVARAADLFICECSCFPRGCEPARCRDTHLSWEDVAEICQESEPKQLLITHLYQAVLERTPNPLESLQATLPIPVGLAEDGASYTV